MSTNGNNDQKKESCTDCQVYLAALYELTRKPFTFTEEELRELRENGKSIDPLIEELERRVGA
jgi:hypothetical protein